MVESGYTLVLTEKPDAAMRVAKALGKTVEKRLNGISYFAVDTGNEEYIVCAASGHLFSLSDPEMNRSVYPVYDVDWFPTYQVLEKQRNSRLRSRKMTSFLSRRLSALSVLSKGAKSFVHACDYDLEGETIGANILELVCRPAGRPTLRAKFSTLTTDEVRTAFSSLSKFENNTARAGRMRHYLDFIWGINLSRALSEAARSENTAFRLLTMGRVQGPTTAFVVSREIEKKTYVPLPFWQVAAILEKNGIKFEAVCANQKIYKRSEADMVYKSISTASKAKVVSVTRSIERVPPPFPFSLGDLQKEAFRLFRFSPSITLSIAERLYLDALISYPRTASQKLPPSIGYSKILDKLSKQPEFSECVVEIREFSNGFFNPRQGPNDDAAHPAIYPTGERRIRKLSVSEQKIYGLVARRFLCSFMRSTELERTDVKFLISEFNFNSQGIRRIENGWAKFYPTPKIPAQRILPFLLESELVEIVQCLKKEDYEAGPGDYSEASLLSKLETENIGTKATRAEILSTLIDRGYLIRDRGSLKPTDTGLKLVEVMERCCNAIISPELTRDIEFKIEKLSNAETDEYIVAQETVTALTQAIKQLRSFDKFIKEEFANPSFTGPEKKNDRNSTNFVVGDCPSCNEGKIRIIRSIKSGKRFLGCTRYSQGCRTSAPLPQRGIIRSTGKKCDACGWPTISVRYYSRGRLWESCPNYSCRTRTQSTKLNDA